MFDVNLGKLAGMTLTLPAPGGGFVFGPLNGFSSVTFAKGIISKRNVGQPDFSYDRISREYKKSLDFAEDLGELRKRCKVEGIDGKFFFDVFRSIFRLEWGILSQKCEMGACIFQRQIGKLPLKPQGNWAIFQFLPYFPFIPP